MTTNQNQHTVLTMKTGAAKKLYTVVAANGAVSIPRDKASANRIAERLRKGKDGHPPMAAEVRPA